jgi:hypothetical protein
MPIQVRHEGLVPKKAGTDSPGTLVAIRFGETEAVGQLR